MRRFRLEQKGRYEKLVIAQRLSDMVDKWPIAAPQGRVREAKTDVSEEYCDKQQKAATLHDLRMPTRQSGRSAIRHTGGDCWGCIGPIEVEMGCAESLDFVRQKYEAGLRPGWVDPFKLSMTRKPH